MTLPARKHKALPRHGRSQRDHRRAFPGRSYPAITALAVGKDSISAELSDGRVVSIPIAWFPRLAGATREQLLEFEISPAGYGVHWPEIDEDISIKAFLD